MTTETAELQIAELNPKLAAVRAHCEYYRRDAQRVLDIIDAAEPLVMRLPEFVLPCIGFSSGEWMQISSPTREQVLAVISALGGKWEKKLSDAGGTKLDYEATIDGVRVIIYSADPPTTCRIVEELEYVPAHNRIKRTLVCH